MKQTTSEFQRVFITLQLELTRTKMRTFAVEPTFVRDRSAGVH